jgi:gluconokinase
MSHWDGVEVIIIMGVSGSGKSSLARLLATALGAACVEGDDFHPPANMAKMAAGVALGDADRRPWLDALGAGIAQRVRQGSHVVAACSALKRCYRDRLRSALDQPPFFVCLNPGRAILEAHLRGRAGHFMAPSLLASQLETLELPAADEDAMLISRAAPPAELLGEVLERLRGGISR